MELVCDVEPEGRTKLGVSLVLAEPEGSPGLCHPGPRRPSWPLLTPPVTGTDGGELPLSDLVDCVAVPGDPSVDGVRTSGRKIGAPVRASD